MDIDTIKSTPALCSQHQSACPAHTIWQTHTAVILLTVQCHVPCALADPRMSMCAQYLGNMGVMHHIDSVLHGERNIGKASPRTTIHCMRQPQEPLQTKRNQAKLQRDTLTKHTILLQIHTPPGRSKSMHRRRTYIGMQQHAPGEQAGDHPAPAHREHHNPATVWTQGKARSPPRAVR